MKERFTALSRSCFLFIFFLSNKKWNICYRVVFWENFFTKVKKVWNNQVQSTKVQTVNISYSKYSFVNPFKIFWISFVQFYFCKGSFILWELSLFCIEHKSFVHLTLAIEPFQNCNDLLYQEILPTSNSFTLTIS